MPVPRFHALWLALLAAACVAGTATSSSGVTLEATMILASDQAAAQDPRLEFIEYKLRRIFGFEYYSYQGGDSASVALPGTVSLNPGRGSTLSVHVSDAGGDRVRASVQWLRGGTVVLNTTVAMKRGAPVILGGISEGKGKLIVTLVAR